MKRVTGNSVARVLLGLACAGMGVAAPATGCTPVNTAGADASAGAGDAGADDGGIDESDRAGGTYLLTDGTSITTRYGASMPRLGRPVLGPSPKPMFVHLGLGGDPTRGVAILWRTPDDATLASTVQYGTGRNTDQTLEGVTFLYDTPPRNAVRMHEAHLVNLKPATTYSYRVGGKGAGGVEAWSDIHQFHTAPDLAADPTAQVTIGVFGDTRDNLSVFTQTLAAFKKQMPDLLVFSGDAVLVSTIQDMWESWFMAAGEDVLASIPMVNAMGNHDVNSINYFSQVANPGDEENYSLDYGAAHFTVLNDSPPGGKTELQNKTMTFLDADLGAATTAQKRWKFVVHHRPLYSSADRGGNMVDTGGNLFLRGLFVPLYDKYDVDIVFNGHDHNYERFNSLRADRTVPAGGTIYLIAGSAGANLYPRLVMQDPRSAKSIKTYCYAIATVSKTTANVTAYDMSGTVIDQLPAALTKP